MKSILGLRYLAHKKIKDRWVAQGYLKVLAPLEGKWNTVRVKGSEICFPNTPRGSCEETVCKDPEPAGVGVVACGRRDAASN